MRKMMVVLLTGLFFSGCGGGGSSSGGSGDLSAAFTGNTNQATVTTSNARAVSVDAMAGVQTTSTIGVLAKATTGNQPSYYLLQVAGVVEQQLADALTKSTAKTVADTISGSQGGYSGSFSYTINGNPSTGAASGTIRFNAYQVEPGGPRVSGEVSFSGTVNMSTGVVSGMDMTLANLTTTSSTQSASLSGNFSVRHSGTTATVTMSVVATDLTSHRTYWFKDLSITLTGTTMSISGTYFDHTYGFVAITTVTPLNVSGISDQPISGRLLFTGTGGTKARLTYTSTGYILDVDTNGSNSFVAVP